MKLNTSKQNSVYRNSIYRNGIRRNEIQFIQMEFIKTKKSKIDIYYQLFRGCLHGERVTLLGG